MEQIIGLLVALAIWLLPALISGKKKARQQQVQPQQQASKEPSPLETMKRILQEMADDGDEVLYDEKEESDNAEPAFEFEEEGQPVYSQQEAQPFFSFEEGQPATSMDSSSVEEPNEEPMQQHIEVRLEETSDNNSSALDEPFDLRKAIIYQTILQNKYVTNSDC